jgi:hypothetical protein
LGRGRHADETTDQQQNESALHVVPSVHGSTLPFNKSLAFCKSNFRR